MLLKAEPKHLVISKKDKYLWEWRAFQKLDVLRGWGSGGQGSFRGLRWGESSGFDQWVSDVMLDSFRSKLQGLTSLVHRMAVFWFNYLDRHLINMLLNTTVGGTLDSGDTSSPLTLWSALQDFVPGGLLVAFHVDFGECGAV